MSRFQELPKAYDASSVEDAIYSAWESSGVFNPDNLPDRNQNGEPYCIVMPPPNVTGVLHLGHALENALMDTMARFQRMRGKRVMLIPGTDHAAIATQAKVEKLLMEQGIKDPRKELGREKLLEKIREFSEGSKATILSQVKKMGTTCDWSRLAYTFDDARNATVKELFVRMYRDGLIYRGERIVNWDPRTKTVVSDDEIEWLEETAPFYTFKYGPFEISTSRPETKFGDKYVVMHPDDPRYAEYTDGQRIDLEWINGPITATIIKDAVVDKEFGTGAMTITPWHDNVDYELGERRGLDKEQVIDLEGRLLPIAGEFAGMPILEARKSVVEKLKQKGLLVKVDEHYAHRIATNQRGGGMIEPQILRQWWLNVNKPIPGRGKSMCDLMREAVTTGLDGDATQKVTITPDRFTKLYIDRVNNLRDWCLSRQLWWGHRIPAWYRGDEVFVGKDAPEGEGWEQDPDTLDTWFSSGTWTFSALGWPQTRIILVRHGQAQSNVKGILDDQVDTTENGLTDEGKRQIMETAAKLKAEGAVALYASPMVRAQQSAEILATELGLEVHTDHRLREVGVGTFDGKTEVAFESARGPMKDWYETAPDGIEPFVSLKQRTHAFIDEMRAKHAGQTVVVVSHGDAISALGAYGTELEWLASYPETGHAIVIEIATDGRQQTDVSTFHPTAWIQMGYEILYLWLMRMILTSAYALGEIPFKDAYIHGLLRDKDGNKFSKSSGNNIDPIEVINQYGCDALRISVLLGISPGNDSRYYTEKIESGRNFTNKLWNISRFILMTIGDAPLTGQPEPKSLADRWIMSRLDAVIASVTAKIETYQFSAAGEELRDFTWGDLADWYLEIAKIEKGKEAILSHILQNVLKLWHPFMPFVTTHIWQTAGYEGDLIVAAWPAAAGATSASSDFEVLRTLITDMRRLRAEQGIEAAKQVEFALVASADVAKIVEENMEVVKYLARASTAAVASNIQDGWVTTVSGSTTIGLNIAGSIDVAKEREKAQKELEATAKYVDSLNKQLANDEFTSKAPASVIDGMKMKLSDAESKLRVLEEKLKALAS